MIETCLRDDHVFLIAKIAAEKVPLDDANASELSASKATILKSFGHLFLEEGYAQALELYQELEEQQTRLLTEHEWK